MMIYNWNTKYRTSAMKRGVRGIYIPQFGRSQAKFSDISHANIFNTASTYVSKGIVTGALDDVGVGHKETYAHKSRLDGTRRR